MKILLATLVFAAFAVSFVPAAFAQEKEDPSLLAEETPADNRALVIEGQTVEVEKYFLEEAVLNAEVIKEINFDTGEMVEDSDGTEGAPEPGLVNAGEPPPAQLYDGIYEGSNSQVDVTVSVLNGKIIDIKILNHRGGGDQYRDMLKPLLDSMVRKQSTELDGVSGATVSSQALKEAVEDALKKAAQP
ncbi:MAG: FMN-binding protein [Candidatus Omnitrophota bacterium]